jgi:CRP/FNR family transcriptional regulator, cyclic AMP receptor protein
MSILNAVSFNPFTFLAAAKLRNVPVAVKARRAFFSQGEPADSVFFLTSGHVKLTAISSVGREATIALLVPGDFVGEEAFARKSGCRMTTARALVTSSALKIEKSELVGLLDTSRAFADYFLRYMLARSLRTQADLIDQLFNSSEKRLARILLLMAQFGKPGEVENLIPPITQLTLAQMVGTTRPRVSFFMNRFRKLGFVQYNGRIRVHKSLLNVVLHDRLPDENTKTPEIADKDVARAKPGKKSEKAPAKARRKRDAVSGLGN